MTTALSPQGIDHLNLQVHDLSSSIRFYDALFGFAIVEDGRDDPEPWAILSAQGNAFMALYEDSDCTVGSGGGFNHFGLVVGDIDHAIAVLERLKISPRLFGGQAIIRYPRSRSVYVRDPSGYEIELVERFGGGHSFGPQSGSSSNTTSAQTPSAGV